MNTDLQDLEQPSDAAFASEEGDKRESRDYSASVDGERG